MGNGIVSDPVLGWRRLAGSEIRVFAIDRTRGPGAESCYGIGADGLRIGSGEAPADAPAVLVLGDSFGFGLHLNDDETLPYLLEERSRGAYDGINLATDGWGPHQTVALLETGLDRRVIGRRRVALGVYVSALDPFRPMGTLSWARSGPRYVLDRDGRLHDAGRLEDHGTVRALVEDHSAIGEALGRAVFPPRPDLDLYVALLERASRLFREHHRVPLVVVLQQGYDALPVEPLLGRLQARGVDACSLKDLLPADPHAIYWVPGDGHPTRTANAALAEHLLAVYLPGSGSGVTGPR